ncbi:MAG: RluA family pseudouridine synthase [Actinobacteria bacterium]|nr:RluA family pseudouridine synthase [Actinomycetota bacterium]
MLNEIIPAALNDQRLDRIVALVADVSRASAASLIQAGGVVVDGVCAVTGKTKIAEGQSISIDTALLPKKELPTADTTVILDVVFEDADVVVINKNAGLVVHPGAGNPTGTMVNGALARFPEMASAGDPLRPGVVHRLDAGTTGLMVMAKTQAAYEALVDALSKREVKRTYLALVWGHLTVLSGTIDAPIGRDQKDPTRMGVVVDGKAARTRFEVKSKFDLPLPSSLVECNLETGRTHQIRVHLESIGHPVVGDSTYGGARSSLSAPRPMLHALQLAFSHPISGQSMSFEAEMPDDMKALLARCS